MYGLVIPSLLQQELEQSRKGVKDLVNNDPILKRLGNGLAVSRDGQVVIEPRVAPPSRMEAEDMQAALQKFADYLRGETGDTKSNVQKAAYSVEPQPMVTKATDPVVQIQPYVSPPDFANEFGVPIDTTEIIALCEELGLYNALPEVVNGSVTDSWREMNQLDFVCGTQYIAFAKGACPEETQDASINRTVTKKHIGAKKTLAESDIVHSMASISAGYGIRELVGAVPSNTNFGEGVASFTRQSIASLKEKEIRKQMTLVLNGWDELLVKGNASSFTNEFDGFETVLTGANGVRVNPNNSAYSGTFSASRFDQFLSAGCARPTHIFAHPTTLSAVKQGFWSMGANSAPQQTIFQDNPVGIIPGWTLANTLNTSVGTLPLVPDTRFTRVDNSDGTFNGDIFALRMVHNGEPLVYRATQIPLSYKDLVPGCSTISFMTWAVTGLVVKHLCAHAKYTSKFTGLVLDGCHYVYDY